MEGYNISEIEFEDGDQPEVSELLTGEIIKGIDPKSGIKPNAEVEEGEFVKFNDGTVQRVVGNEHKKGGVAMALEDGNQVLSNKLKLNKEQSKRLSKQFEIQVSTKDTYAEALEKYVKKIGLSKLYTEQKDWIEKLEKQKDTKDEATLGVNKEYLAYKIKQIEDQKADKEILKTAFYDRVFDMQETTKPQVETAEGSYAYGGTSYENLKKVAERNGLSLDQALEITGQRPQTFDKGGVFGNIQSNIGKWPDKDVRGAIEVQLQDGNITVEEADQLRNQLANPNATPVNSGTFRVKTTPTTFSNDAEYERVKQSKSSGAFGKITKESLPSVLAGLYRNFPDIVSQDDVFGVKIDENGNVTYNDNIDFTQATEQVKNFQDRAKARMEASADIIIKNPSEFGEEAVKQAQDFKKNETFDESTARGLDSKLGNFTSGRYNLGLDIVQPEELKKLGQRGIFTLNQLKTAIDNGTVTDLSESSISRVNRVAELQKNTPNSDFSLFTVEPDPVVSPNQPIVEEPILDATGDIVDNINYRPRNNYPRMFYTPDQTGLLPSPLQVGTLTENRFGRIDPVRIGIDQQRQSISNSEQFVASQLSGMPSSQRAGALASFLASSNQAINQTATEANRINAQNVAAAEQFNIGQQDRENVARSQNLLNYEARAYTAQAKTEEELRNWYDRNQAVALNNFKNNQNLNLLESVFPDYRLDFMGASVSYDPSSDFQFTSPNGQALPPNNMNYNDYTKAGLARQLEERDRQLMLRMSSQQR